MGKAPFPFNYSILLKIFFDLQLHLRVFFSSSLIVDILLFEGNSFIFFNFKRELPLDFITVKHERRGWDGIVSIEIFVLVFLNGKMGFLMARIHAYPEVPLVFYWNASRKSTEDSKSVNGATSFENGELASVDLAITRMNLI